MNISWYHLLRMYVVCHRHRELTGIVSSVTLSMDGNPFDIFGSLTASGNCLPFFFLKAKISEFSVSDWRGVLVFTCGCCYVKSCLCSGWALPRWPVTWVIVKAAPSKSLTKPRLEELSGQMLQLNLWMSEGCGNAWLVSLYRFVQSEISTRWQYRNVLNWEG